MTPIAEMTLSPPFDRPFWRIVAEVSDGVSEPGRDISVLFCGNFNTSLRQLGPNRVEKVDSEANRYRLNRVFHRRRLLVKAEPISTEKKS